MTDNFNPDWACKPDCVASEVLKEHLRTRAVLQPPVDAERGEALEALELMRLRAYTHATISNSPEHMIEWIDKDAAKIKVALSVPAWRPISEAPRDGTPILITVRSTGEGPCIYVAWNRDGKWTVFDSGHGHRAYVEAVLWQPIKLPAPSTEGGI